MNTMNYKLSILLMILIFLIGCNNSQTGISTIKVGKTGNEVNAFIGQDLHFKTNIYFPEGIKLLTVTFEPIKKTDWSYVKDYTTDVKQHNQYHLSGVIPIPVYLAVGIYKLCIKAVSEVGETAEEETEINLKVDSSMPFASKIDVGLNAKKDNLHLESEITASKKIKSVKVQLKWGSFSKTYTYNTGAMIGALQHTFHEHLDLKDFKNGKYDVIFIVEDQEGRLFETKGDFIK